MIVKISIFLTLILLIALFVPMFLFRSNTKSTQWDIQSIDTMKYSRDLAREKSKDAKFLAFIDWQVSEIAKTGATHISIATPYDEEFMPFLQKWVTAARLYHLHVWFRGNMSGWEGWFDYPRIDRTTHTKKTRAFILAHPELFEDGDIFSSCPECENGGPGDPRATGDIKGHRKFLIDEYHMTSSAFNHIHKNVSSNFNGMNYDVALAIMDQTTVSELNGVIVVDHYVRSPEQTVSDLLRLSQKSQGLIVLGEFGAPIPDIHGSMTEDEQDTWIRTLLSKLAQHNVIIGVNYWTALGASTEIWDSKQKPRKAVKTLSSFFKVTHL